MSAINILQGASAFGQTGIYIWHMVGFNSIRFKERSFPSLRKLRFSPRNYHGHRSILVSIYIDIIRCPFVYISRRQLIVRTAAADDKPARSSVRVINRLRSGDLASWLAGIFGRMSTYLMESLFGRRASRNTSACTRNLAVNTSDTLTA